MIPPFRFHRRAIAIAKKWVALTAILVSGFGATAFTTNDAATIFNAFNTAFMSGGAYSGWWTHAELLEMAQDAYDNSPSVARRNIVTSTCNGFLSQNGSNWMYNEYNDDIAWAVIAFSRAHLITGSANYQNVAQSNFDGMFARGWDTNFFGGGIWWRQSDRQSKNACIQGPAAIAACYLYQITGDIGYLDKAKAIHAWNRAVLFNPSNGSVYDNIGTNGVVDTVALTYNQGTFIGSANFLYRATGLPGYYQDAILAGKRAQNGMTTAGILPEWSSNTDLSGFNGIFARWMARFAKDQNLWASFGPWLGTNANAAWSVRNTNNLAWQKWRTPTPNSGSEIGNWGCSAAVVVMQVADPDPDALKVTPTAGFTAVAQVGQLPGATSVNFILTNTSASPLNWTLGNTSTWLNVSVSSGTLPAFGATLVNVSLIPSATTNFAAGRYFANVAVTNLTSGIVAQRIFTLALSGGAAPILMTGFNANVLAPNTATAGAPGATGFDVPNSYSFYQAGLSGSTRGLPPDGVFTSQWDQQTVFQFRPYGSLNTLLLGYTYPNSATLTLTTPRAYQNLTILACSAHGGGMGTFVLNFTNGTQSPVFSFNAQDWFGGTANVAITALGRLKLSGSFGAEDNGAANPNMYQTTINLAALGQDKEIASITFTRPAGAGATQTTAIFAVSGILAYREPVITQQPAPQQLFRFAGASNSWSVVANAAQSVSYQWQLNGAALPGATSASYQLPNLQTNDSGNYTVVLSNAYGMTTSSVAALTVAPAPTYPFGQAVLAAGPLAYWRLDESGGTVAHDYVSTNNGIYNNVLLGQPGHKLVDTHTAARFGFLSANNSCVTNIQLDFAAGNNGVFSVEAWVNGGAQTSDAGLVTKGFGSGGEQFNLDCGGPNRAFRFFVRERYGTARLATSSVVANNQWYHLVAVCDQANGFVRLYVNGNQAGQGSITPNVGLLPSLAPVSIGSRQAGLGSAYNNQFAGFMQEVAIYGYALSPSQVLAHYQTATNRAPIFVSNPFTVANGNAGQSYSGNLSTYVSEPNGDPVTYAKLSGPTWLTVTSGGNLSGNPLSANVDTNTFIVRATDAGGLTSFATMNLPVLAAPPLILSAYPQAEGLLLSWMGGIAPYQVQETTNLLNPNWQNVGPLSGANSLWMPRTNPAAFFRVHGR